MQNDIAGPPIRIVVKIRDDASWPKTTLPPKRNFCHEKQALSEISLYMMIDHLSIFTCYPISKMTIHF